MEMLPVVATITTAQSPDSWAHLLGMIIGCGLFLVGMFVWDAVSNWFYNRSK